MKLTKNFSLSEFECKCNCKMPDDVFRNIIKVANNLQVLRDSINVPITITNAYRCAEHNKAVGGVTNSQHILGKAVDIKARGFKPVVLANLINDLIEQCHLLQGGIGVYRTFVHYDIRKTKVRWHQ